MVRSQVPHVRPGDEDERQCPACSREFKTAQGLMSHLSSARSCRWYKKGKNKDTSAYSVPNMIRTAAQAQVTQQSATQEHYSAMDEDEHDFEDIMESHDLFELIPAFTSADGHGEGQSSSSSSAGPSQYSERRQAQLPPSLNDDEDSRVVDEPDEELVGKVIKMSEAVVKKWKAYFWEEPEKDRMDVDEGEG